MKVTLDDIAKVVGVSKNSVSRALNDSNEISKKTKEKVKKVAAELGYVGNRAAKSLRSGKTNLVAIVFDDMVNPYFSSMSKLLQTKLRCEKYDSLIFTTDSQEFDKDLFSVILFKNVDAIITFIKPSLKTINLASKHKIPIICLGRKSSSEYVDTFITDDIKGGRLAFKALHDLGCKKMGYLGPVSKVETSIRRLNGFKEAAYDNDCKITNNDLFIVNLGEKIKDEYLERIIKDYDGIFCYNDLMAYDLLLNTDRKVKLVGFDNIQEGLFTNNTLTTISSDKNLITTKVVKRVLDRISDYNLDIVLEEFDVNLVLGR